MRMKRLFSVLMCLCLLFALSASAFAETQIKDYSNLDIKYCSPGVYAVYAPAKLTIFLVGYQNGKMLYVKQIQESTLPATVSADRTFSVPESNADTLKLFFVSDDSAPMGMIVTTPDQLPKSGGMDLPGIDI